MSEALGLLGISKRFGAVEALCNADFSLAQGEIHALLGENGAGKSTLMRVAFGLVRPDAGVIRIQGVDRRVGTPSAARALGLGMVHQHFTSIPAFTVLENISLAAGWAPLPSRNRARLDALMGRTGFTLAADARTGDLSAGLKQRLEVLQALATDARVLLLDEPSSVLPPGEADSFLSGVQALRQSGVSAVLITHKLDEALRIADRITVLRRGRVVYSSPRAETTSARLATEMLGEPPPAAQPRQAAHVGEVRVRVEGAAAPRVGATGTGLRRVSIEVRAGEVVGIAAVEGNGQRELFRVLAGVMEPEQGVVSIADPVAFIPEDRTREGLIGSFTLTENLVLSRGPSAPWIRGQWIDWSSASRRMAELAQAFNVQVGGPATPISALSGGNQQRIMIAAALDRHPAVLLAENPTRGLDIRATAEVHRRLREAAQAGAAVIVHLPDLDELLGLADRIVVLSAGEATEMPPSSTREEIGHRLLARQ